MKGSKHTGGARVISVFVVYSERFERSRRNSIESEESISLDSIDSIEKPIGLSLLRRER